MSKRKYGRPLTAQAAALKAYRDHHKHITDHLLKQSFRETATAVGLSRMQIYRYVHEDGHVQAHVHYILAAYVGVQLQLPLTPLARKRKAG